MLSVEGVITELQRKNVQVLALCCDNIDSVHVWAASLGNLPFPVLSDFWPHGKVSEAYGVFNQDGVPDRALILLDGEGRIRYLDLLLDEDVPQLQPMLEICEQLNCRLS